MQLELGKLLAMILLLTGYVQAINVNYGFNTELTINESGSPETGSNLDFWLSSGGYFFQHDYTGMTIHGDLPIGDYWQQDYSISNPIDTDNGLHPQNIFRIVTKNAWNNFEMKESFMIDETRLSNSPNRAATNGLWQITRYKDQNNLYYSGCRVDGYCQIKKKINGNYYTLSSAKIFAGTYNHDTNPTLLPQGQWITLKTIVKTNSDGSVTLKLYKLNGSTWTLLTQTTDSGTGGKPITGTLRAGTRTDFMDVQLENWKFTDN